MERPGLKIATVLLTAALLPLVACASAQSALPAPAEEQAQVELSALQHFEKKKDLTCAPGKEHWRVQGTPKRGGHLVKTASNASHLDLSQPGGNITNSSQVYEHLVETRACYYEDMVMVPKLARSWEVSADGLTWTLQLREGVKWHNKPPVNGRAFTAQDVAWTIEHQKAGGLLRSAWAPVKYEVTGPLTIVLTLPEPQADFLGNVLGERNSVMMPREVREQYGDFKSTAIGTGPFMFKSYATGQRVSLERNPDWREMGMDGKSLPYIESMDAVVFGDYAAEVAAVRAGQLDINSTQGFFKRDADALRETNRKLVVYQDVAAMPRSLWMLLDQKPFDDLRVRKGIALAIDHDDVIDGAFQGGAMRTSHLPSSIVDYAWAPSKVREKYATDRNRATQLLKEAGFGPENPLKFTMKTSTAPRDISGAEIVQNHLGQVGVQASIEQVGDSVSTVLNRRDYVVAWGGNSPSSTLPDRWMGGFVRCKDSRNPTNLCDPDIDRLSLAQARELDPAKRKVILDQMQDILYEKMYWVPTLSIVYYRFYACRIKNLAPPDYNNNNTGLTGAWMDDTGC